VVEDHPVNQRLAQLVLEKKGHQVVLAENGKSALAILHTDCFDILTMDVQMSGMDGLKTTRRIRADETLTNRQIPILAMTAYARPDDRQRCLDAGMDEYVSKPLDWDDVTRKIGDIVARVEPARNHIGAHDDARVDEIFDRNHALDSTAGSEEILVQLFGIFLESFDDHVRTIRETLDTSDIDTLKMMAHNYKSTAACLGGLPASRAAAELEQSIMDNGFSEETILLANTFLNEIEQLRAKITADVSEASKDL